MASPLKSLQHGRSFSLPSDSSSDISSRFESNLTIIRASGSTCSSLSSMNNQVSSLHKLYNNIEDFLMLPHIQTLISHNSQQKCIDQVLDGHIHLLDACSSTKDLISHSKQDLQELGSALRRNDANAINGYCTSRRMSKKIVEKSLKNMKTFRIKDTVKNESISVVHMFEEAEWTTFSMLESFLTSMMGIKGQSLLSKLMGSKKISSQTNEFDDILKMSSEDDSLMNHLKKMESSIQTLEEELECLFRQLIKTRVSLLNILNN